MEITTGYAGFTLWNGSFLHAKRVLMRIIWKVVTYEFIILCRESDDAQVTDFSDASDTFLKAEKMLESVSTFLIHETEIFTNHVDLDVITKDHLRIDIQTNLAIIKKDQGDPDGGIVILEKALNSSTAKRKNTYFCIDFIVGRKWGYSSKFAM